MTFRLRPPKIKLVENDVERQCLDVLRLRGFNPIRLQSGKLKTPDGRWVTIGEVGIPDYAIPQFFLETKRPGGRLSEAQQTKIFELEKCWGLETVIVESVDELILWLDRRAGKAGK